MAKLMVEILENGTISKNTIYNLCKYNPNLLCFYLNGLFFGSTFKPIL